MSRQPHRLNRFWQDLKRRNVVRVITVYAAVSFVILQLVEILAPSLRLPDWTMNFILALLIIGFIVAVILSWIYDIRPEGGLEKTAPVKGPELIQDTPSSNGWKIASYLSLVVIVFLIVLNILPRISGSKKISRMEKSIAVLPFYFYSSDEKAQDIGDAFANEITAQLCKVTGFDRVISHTSTRQFKGSDRLSIPEIGKALNANFIIEGSLERQNEEVSIHILIIEAAGDDHLWAYEFKGNWADIFSIRARIAQAVARELSTLLSPEEIKEIEKVPTNNLDAYDYFLLGVQLHDINTTESMRKAMEYFKASLAIDPAYVDAYVKLAFCYGNLAFMGSIRPMEAYPEMLKLANLVLELDSLSGYGYEIKAIIDYYFHYDFASSKKNYEKALALDPDNGEFYRAYADWFTWLGRFDEALETDKKVIELDPLYPYTGILHALHLFLAGERDSAFSVMYAIDKHGGYKGPWLGILYLKEGNYQQAIQEMEHTEILSDPFAVSQLGLAYSKTGNLEMTSSLLDLLESRSRIEYVSYIHRGALLAELGRKQEALDYLRLGYEEREEYLIMLMHFDRLSYAGLRTHPEFLEIMQKVVPR